MDSAIPIMAMCTHMSHMSLFMTKNNTDMYAIYSMQTYINEIKEK